MSLSRGSWMLLVLVVVIVVRMVRWMGRWRGGGRSVLSLEGCKFFFCIFCIFGGVLFMNQCGGVVVG